MRRSPRRCWTAAPCATGRCIPTRCSRATCRAGSAARCARSRCCPAAERRAARAGSVRAAMGLVSVTFDNLGEASEIEGGTWPDDQPLGEHFSVVEILPRLLELLDTHGLRATFFVEGINAEINPRALESIRAGGHEVACHA